MAVASSFLMTEYEEDVLMWMHSKEQQHLPYNGNSPQLAMRSALVEFIRVVCEKLRLSVATTHLSVYLLDRFMDAHQISDNQLRLTALTAILLAAKFEEKDLNVPRIPELNVYASNRYSIQIFNSMEAFMLNFFNWKIGTVTVAHFAELYLMRGVTYLDTIEGNPVEVPSHTCQELWRMTAQFMDISLQDQIFLQWPCSQVAASCVAVGRLCCHLLPTWPTTLQKNTDYPLHALSQIMDLLLRLHESDEKNSLCSTPESGYASNASSIQSSPVASETSSVSSAIEC